MKHKGFSLIELVVVLAIISLLAGFSIKSHFHSRFAAQAQIDRQSLLHIPLLIEKYYTENGRYPNSISEIIVATNGNYLSEHKFYTITYQLVDTTNYIITAIANSEHTHYQQIDCYKVQISSTGLLTAYDINSADINKRCWKR